MVDASAANAPAAQAAARAAGKDAKNGAGASPPPTDDPSLPPPLIIPIQSGTVDPAFIEIFPEELTTVAASTLTSVLAEEDAALSVWSDAALAYVRNRQGGRGSELLQEACRREESGRAGSNNRDRASGDAEQAQRDEELRGGADRHFNRATKIDGLFPMTWIGRGMLHLTAGRTDQAQFFFETTLKQCGQVLPALLGVAAVRYRREDYRGALEYYTRAISLFPDRSGSAARVGFGLACYRLGQVDRAKAAFKRAHAMDPKNAEAMVGLAVLDLASLDETAPDYRSRTEDAIRLLSTANLVDHSNAMVQNHLADHYFWKWTPVPGTISVEAGSSVVKSSQPMNLDAGERVRIGQGFQSDVADDHDEADMDVDGDGDFANLRLKDPWNGPTAKGLKLWKKDYDRVIALARGGLSSTTSRDMMAESYFILARVHHIRSEMELAAKFYDRAIKLAPNLAPARFGLAQTLIWDGQYNEAAAHLKLVLGASAGATDANAALGLLEARSGRDRKAAFSYLKKAIDLDPLSPDLVLLEALALQQQEADYSKSLDAYKRAVSLMAKQARLPSAEVLTNMGVLCHETKKYDEAAEYYGRALRYLDEDGLAGKSSLDCDEDAVRHEDNAMFWNYVDAGFSVKVPEEGATALTVIGGGSKIPDTVHVGDHVRVGKSFKSEITELDAAGGSVSVKDPYVPTHDENEEVAEDKVPQEEASMFLKRANRRLLEPTAVSVAFNLARLHEAAGRIIPAVELHKTIVKRHPSYVNSYLRLACIARDCGSLKDCSHWLKSAMAVSPGNPEVLTLVGNLHLSLCDWAPAQSLFDQLLAQKVPNVEAYSMLNLGNIYFSNLKTPKRYAKHLQYAADFYKRILNKDKANAYAANGLGTILAEKGELVKAKETFSRVREVSGDAIPDTLLNLGHIYLAQKKHPEALQMYQNYINRTKNSGTPIMSKNRGDDEAEVIQYVAFANYDWAKQTEALGGTKAAPADERYTRCIEYLELAASKKTKEDLTLTFNLCMTKLSAANCVLQKVQRGIRRTSQEVKAALDGLEKSLPEVQKILGYKEDGKKVPISSSSLNNFITQCRDNIEAAKSHYSEEMKREKEAEEVQKARREAAEYARLQASEKALLDQMKAAEKAEELDRKATDKMDKARSLVGAWEQEAKDKEEAATRRKAKKNIKEMEPNVDDAALFDVDEGAEDAPAVQDTNALFDDSDGDDEADADSSDKKYDGTKDEEKEEASVPAATEGDLFGSDSDSDEELVKTSTKRGKNDSDEDEGDEGKTSKRRRVLDEDDD